MAEPRHPYGDPVTRGPVADPAHRDPDSELSLSGIVWTAAGIVGVTAVAFILMLWMNGGLIAGIEKAQGPLTPAEIQAGEAVRQAGEERLESGEEPDLPGLAIPADYALPPRPRLEATPTGDIGRLRSRESDVLERWGWADQEAGTVHVPIDEAIGLAVSGGLPGVRLDGSAPPETPPETPAETPADGTAPADAAGGDAGGEPAAVAEETGDAA